MGLYVVLDPDALDEKSPAEILEEHMRACAGQVLREMELQQQQQSGTGSQTGPQGGAAGAMSRSFEREQCGAKDHQPTVAELQKVMSYSMYLNYRLNKLSLTGHALIQDVICNSV